MSTSVVSVIFTIVFKNNRSDRFLGSCLFRNYSTIYLLTEILNCFTLVNSRPLHSMVRWGWRPLWTVNYIIIHDEIAFSLCSRTKNEIQCKFHFLNGRNDCTKIFLWGNLTSYCYLHKRFPHLKFLLSSNFYCIWKTHLFEKLTYFFKLQWGTYTLQYTIN
jgi:hypothetical protein